MVNIFQQQACKSDIKPDWIISFLYQRFVLMVAICAVSIYAMTCMTDCFGPPIRADGVGYYIYLPSLLIYGDLSFNDVADASFEGDIPGWAGLRRIPETGRYVNKYPIGVSLLMLPFFLVAHLVTWCMVLAPGQSEWMGFNYPADGFSLCYQYVAGLSGIVYFLFGLTVLKRLLVRFYSPGIVLLTLTALVFGTNLLHYASGEPVLSHAYSFFLFSLFLCVVTKWYDDPKSLKTSTCLGLIVGIIFLVRMVNVVVVLIFFLYGVESFKDVKQRFFLYIKTFRSMTVMAAVFSLITIIPILILRYSTGTWVFNAYSLGGERFFFNNPQFFNVLFSLKGGLLFWSPVLILCIPGFIYMKNGNARKWTLGVLSHCAIVLYLVASWHMWWFGGGFGHRAFIESYVLLSFPMAATLSYFKARGFLKGASVFVLLLVVYELVMMYMYYTRELSYYGLDRQALFDILWMRKEWVDNLLKTILYNN